MGPRVLDFRGQGQSAEGLGPVVIHVKARGLVAMPTETVYGFGCVPAPEPLAVVQRWKAREPDKPFLLLIPGPESVPELEWTPEARELADVFWPGALTLVLRDPKGRFPEGVRSLEGGVAVRVTPHPLAGALVKAVGEPLVSTSANPPGGKPAVSGDEALTAAVAVGAGEELWVLDAGFLPPSEPSTIIDCTGPAPILRRSGAIPSNRVHCVLPGIHEPS